MAEISLQIPEKELRWALVEASWQAIRQHSAQLSAGMPGKAAERCLF